MLRQRALGFALLLVLVVAPAADAAFPKNAKVVRKDRGGPARFVGTAPGNPIERPRGFSTSSPPAAVGKAFLEQHAADFGLARASAVEHVRSARQPKGATAARYQQTIDGVEVMGGQFVVQLDSRNRVLSVLGESESAGGVDTEPTLTAAQAETRAIAAVAKHQRVRAARLSTSGTAPKLFNDAILGGPGDDRARLVWATTVSDGLAVKRLVLVDAARGSVAASIDQAPEARNRTVCDAGNTASQLPCAAPVLSEGGSLDGKSPDAVDAYTYAGATYDYLLEQFGRDGIDGTGMPLVSTVRYCAPERTCPYKNAFWNGTQMTYGEGFAAADDVVAHEFAHGLTQFTSGLYYYYQSGAINESMSDVFGELVDHATSSPGDTPGDRWKLGESLAVGAIRDMADPGAFGDPDSMTSGTYFAGSADSGGVHTNSGVNNKAASLMVDGGSFNGSTVAALGGEKVGRIYYAVQTGFLTSGSDYKDLGLALGQACDNLVGSHGVTAADCVEVRAAVTATGMLVDRPEAPDMAECPAGQAASFVYLDTIGADAPGWTTTNTDPKWYLDDAYATSGRYSLYAPGYASAADFSIAQSAGTAVPANAFLRFSHAFDFEHDSQGFYDGGVVEASADGGSFSGAFVPAATYPGTLVTGNPLGGRRAFVGVSAGYRTTVVPLSSLAGQSVRFRFRAATDGTVGSFGWDVDDIGVFTCAAAVGPAVFTGAASGLTQTTATVAGTVDANAFDTSYSVEYGMEGALDRRTDEVAVGTGTDPVAVSAALSGLQPGTQYSYRIVAANRFGQTEGRTATFTTAAATATAPSSGGEQAAAPPSVMGPPVIVTPPLPATLRGTARPTRRKVKPARVACVNAVTRVTCRITFPGARKKRRVSATLREGSAIVAKGRSRKPNARGLVTVRGTKGLLPGAYVLSVRVGSRALGFKVRLG